MPSQATFGLGRDTGVAAPLAVVTCLEGARKAGCCPHVACKMFPLASPGIKGRWHRQDAESGFTNFCFLSGNTEKQTAIKSIG